MNEEWRKFDLRTYPLDPLPDLPAFATLMDIWNDKRDGARLPAWPDFDFDTVLPWVGRLAISEFDGKDEFHFVLFGGAFVNLFGRELTGKPLFASLHPDQEPHSRQHFMAMLKGPLIGHGQGSVPAVGRDHKAFNVIDLPLSEHGGDVTHFLHGVVVSEVPATES